MPIFSRFPPETAAAIKDMKRNGMSAPMPPIAMPGFAHGPQQVAQLAGTVAETFAQVASMAPSSPSSRFEYADQLERYMTELGHYSSALAEFASLTDPAFATANQLSPGSHFDAAIDRACTTPERAAAAEAASLAHAMTVAMFATALTCYALRAHTAEDRVVALQSTSRAVELLGRHRSRFA